MSATAAKLTQSFSAYLETIDKTLYDAEPLTTKAVDFFCSARGTRSFDGTQRTLQETNMIMAGVIPAPESLKLIHRPSVTLLSPTGLVSLNREIWQKSLFTFVLNSKIYFQGPLWMFASSVAALYGVKDGFSEKQKKQLISYMLETPVSGSYSLVISPLDPFRATIETSKPNKSIIAYVSLRGDYWRAI